MVILQFLKTLIERNTDWITIGIGGVFVFITLYSAMSFGGNRVRYFVGLFALLAFFIGIMSFGFWIFGQKFMSVVGGQ